MRTFPIGLLALSLTFLTCEKEGEKPTLGVPEYLIFGRYALECESGCTEMYKLENGELYADDLDWGLPEATSFQNTSLSTDQYTVAVVLQNEFPSDLLASEKRKYGCPDCYDQGGYYLSVRRNGTVDTWLLDTDNDEQSDEIIQFKARIDEVLDAL